jgi:hypothetical protein
MPDLGRSFLLFRERRSRAQLNGWLRQVQLFIEGPAHDAKSPCSFPFLLMRLGAHSLWLSSFSPAAMNPHFSVLLWSSSAAILISESHPRIAATALPILLGTRSLSLSRTTAPSGGQTSRRAVYLAIRASRARIPFRIVRNCPSSESPAKRTFRSRLGTLRSGVPTSRPPRRTRGPRAPAPALGTTVSRLGLLAAAVRCMLPSGSPRRRCGAGGRGGRLQAPRRGGLRPFGGTMRWLRPAGRCTTRSSARTGPDG